MSDIRPNVVLREDQIGEFWERGYVTLPAITSKDELMMFRGIFERLFSKKIGRNEGAQFDMMTHDEDDEPERLPTIISPVTFAPELRETLYRANACAIASQLLGPNVASAFEHAILKPPRQGAPTPWHQDEATRLDANFSYEQLSIWMPLQEATIENGCMHYIAGSHKGEVLAHRSANNDRKLHAIECSDAFDPGEATSCPVPAGGAAIHHGRTLHYAGPNATDGARIAYILAFQNPPVLVAGGRNFYWNREKETAKRLIRRNAWRKRGGIVVEFLRRARYGDRETRKQMLFKALRSMRGLLTSK